MEKRECMWQSANNVAAVSLPGAPVELPGSPKISKMASRAGVRRDRHGEHHTGSGVVGLGLPFQGTRFSI